jgi:hypothetical protein
MKMQFDNIKSFEYTVEFHDLHLYYNDDDNEKMEYLFCLNNQVPNILNKKILMPINTKHFVQFIKDCLEYPVENLSKHDFEINIIQLIDKYNNNFSFDILNLINIKLGNLILSHIKFKNFAYLKNLHKQFGSQNKLANIKDIQFFNSQICYLIILLNNLISVKKQQKNNQNYRIKKSQVIQLNQINQLKTENFDYLDFIFDYWS